MENLCLYYHQKTENLRPQFRLLLKKMRDTTNTK